MVSVAFKNSIFQIQRLRPQDTNLPKPQVRLTVKIVAFFLSFFKARRQFY